MGMSVPELLVPGRGVVTSGGDPCLRARLAYLARTGALHRVLPDTYVHPAALQDTLTLARAVQSFDPSAVITGCAAAALTFYRDLPVPLVEAAVPYLHPNTARLRFNRRSIPSELVVGIGDIRVTAPALTALDLCTTDLGPQSLDRALQRQAVTVPALWAALKLTPGRPGNELRARLLRDVKSGGCSTLERAGHAALRGAGITEWIANRAIRIRGRKVLPDLRFRDRMLVIEFDGFEFHSSREAYERDRRRQNLLVAEGFLVLRITWRMLEEDLDEVISLVRRALKVASPY